MKLTPEQTTKAREVRAIFDTSQFRELVLAYDFSDAMALILDGVNTLADPGEMQARFNQLWAAYARLWSSENRHIIVEALGGDGALWDRITEHPNGAVVGHGIMERIRDAHGELTPGMKVDIVHVDDLLLDHFGADFLSEDETN
jgi:hypothetical protein